jgi:hypothetical protein
MPGYRVNKCQCVSIVFPIFAGGLSRAVCVLFPTIFFWVSARLPRKWALPAVASMKSKE